MNQYVQVQKLGHGTFGVALLVKERLGDALRVIKQIDVSRLPPDDRSAAHSEVRSLLQLSHPHIIAHTASFLEGYELCIVREFVDGSDLGSAIRRRRQEGGRFEGVDAVRIGAQCLTALSYAHAMKVLHRNLECHNIFLTKSGDAKVGDFGISKVVEYMVGKAASTMAAPGHLAPEVCQGYPYQSSADIWSIGVVLYTVLSMRPPFESINAPTLVNKIINTEPAPLPQEAGLEEARDVVQLALRKQPDRRPSAEDLLNHAAFADYTAALAAGSPTSSAASPSNVTGHRRQRRASGCALDGMASDGFAEGMTGAEGFVAVGASLLTAAKTLDAGGSDAVDRLLGVSDGPVNPKTPPKSALADSARSVVMVEQTTPTETRPGSSSGIARPRALCSLRDAPPLRGMVSREDVGETAVSSLAARTAQTVVGATISSSMHRGSPIVADGTKRTRQDWLVDSPTAQTHMADRSRRQRPSTPPGEYIGDPMLESATPMGSRMRGSASTLALAGGAMSVRPPTSGLASMGQLPRPMTNGGLAGGGVECTWNVSDYRSANEGPAESLQDRRFRPKAELIVEPSKSSSGRPMTVELPLTPPTVAAEAVNQHLDQLMGELMEQSEPVNW